MPQATPDIHRRESVEHFIESAPNRSLLYPNEVAATVVFCRSPTGGVLYESVVSAPGGFTDWL